MTEEKSNLKKNVIHVGDSSKILKQLPGGSVDLIVTSPPYFGQRDYLVKNQIGMEKTVGEYVKSLIDIFSECKRVLANHGSLWIILGDKYINKTLTGAPWRVALALIDDGWILRSDIIWHKPNAMPTSVKNRPTTDHEYIFFFAKSNDYYYDADAIREPHITFTEKSKMKGGRNHFGKRGSTPEKGKNGGNPNLHNARWDQAFHPKGRNKRTVWSIPLSKYKGSHFAVFPEKLVATCILAGTKKGDVVLDPFFGSGTTGVASIKNDRYFIGIELNPDYVELAKKRLKEFSFEEGQKNIFDFA